MKHTICEPEKQLPVVGEADVCVCGGGCTGVFAAIRAARLGCSVILCEETNVLGAAAVNGLVNIWHSLNDTEDKQQIIAGLTTEVLARLEGRGALAKSSNRSVAYNFNPVELAFVLDEMRAECGIDVRFHTKVCGTMTEGSCLEAVIVEDHDGRGAVKAGLPPTIRCPLTFWCKRHGQTSSPPGGCSTQTAVRLALCA